MNGIGSLWGQILDLQGYLCTTSMYRLNTMDFKLNFQICKAVQINIWRVSTLGQGWSTSFWEIKQSKWELRSQVCNWWFIYIKAFHMSNIQIYYSALILISRIIQILHFVLEFHGGCLCRVEFLTGFSNLEILG